MLFCFIYICSHIYLIKNQNHFLVSIKSFPNFFLRYHIYTSIVLLNKKSPSYSPQTFSYISCLDNANHLF